MWSWTEMLFLFCPVESKDYIWIPIGISRERWIEKFCSRWITDYLLENIFSENPRKCVQETQASWRCNLQSTCIWRLDCLFTKCASSWPNTYYLYCIHEIFSKVALPQNVWYNGQNKAVCCLSTNTPNIRLHWPIRDNGLNPVFGHRDLVCSW